MHDHYIYIFIYDLLTAETSSRRWTGRRGREMACGRRGQGDALLHARHRDLR